MPWQKNLLTVAAAAAVAAAFASSEASARHRRHWTVPAADYCGGGLSAYGRDACGFPEFSYGDGCWARVIVNTPEGLRPRRVRTCGREAPRM